MGIELLTYYLAPMEGLTGYIYRNVYSESFPKFDKYFTPFIVPGAKGILKTREQKEISPENNRGLLVIPQILTNQAEGFLRTVQLLEQYGYREVNLNLGCPSGTVTAKGKGAGFLGSPRELKLFLDEIFQKSKLKISVKTRIGVEDPEEFGPLLELFNQYPMEELIIHPRLRREFYKGKPNLNAFEEAVKKSSLPLCYNGDLFTVEDVFAFHEQFPSVERLMIGRGLMGNPGLLLAIRNGSFLTKESFYDFHRNLVEAYREKLSDKDALLRMKELWFYMGNLFEDSQKDLKKIRKSSQLSQYLDIVEELFFKKEFLPQRGFYVV